MKKGLRNYAIRSDTEAERRHITEIASRIFSAVIVAENDIAISLNNIRAGRLMEWSIEYALRIADDVDRRLSQELEETMAEIAREMRQKGAESGDEKTLKETVEYTDDLSKRSGPN